MSEIRLNEWIYSFKLSVIGTDLWPRVIDSRESGLWLGLTYNTQDAPAGNICCPFTTKEAIDEADRQWSVGNVT